MAVVPGVVGQNQPTVQTGLVPFMGGVSPTLGFVKAEASVVPGVIGSQSVSPTLIGEQSVMATLNGAQTVAPTLRGEASVEPVVLAEQEVNVQC